MTDRPSRCQPNFLLIGAAKCGTTSVAKYLDQHPDVFVSKPKEPNYFAFEVNSRPSCRGPVDAEQLYELLLKYSVTSPAAYAGLFDDAQEQRAVGEASVRYLYESHTAKRIAEQIPTAKLIVLLRDPVDRLHSHYHMNVRQHIEPESLAGALDAEEQRIAHGWGWDWHYKRVGMYAEQLQRFYQYYDRSQILVRFQVDLQQRPGETMKSIFEHLEVSPDFQPDFSRRAMVGHTPRWRLLRKIIREDNLAKTLAQHLLPSPIRKGLVSWSESKNRQAIPPLSPALRQQLHDHFADDSRQLEDLLGRKLPW